MIDQLSGLSTYVIGTAFVLHAIAFYALWMWCRRDLQGIASSLDDFTRELRHRSVLDTMAHLSDQIVAFLADVNEVLDDETRHAERNSLLQRINYLDERRRYLQSLAFETSYNICRTMIEAYPLAGVLGTILAIGAALNNPAPTEALTGVGAIVDRFGDAIWSTFAGLAAAILLMFMNSLLEPRFQRLAENREQVREMVARTKRELALVTSETPTRESRPMTGSRSIYELENEASADEEIS